MAQINELGNIIAPCYGCNGATSSFEYIQDNRELGAVIAPMGNKSIRMSTILFEKVDVQFRLFRCACCGSGALACIKMAKLSARYPRDLNKLIWFLPESRERLALPKVMPEGIVNEFREAELCMENNAWRAAAGLFRSVLDKTLRANGYKPEKGISLATQIDEAAKDGVITEARKIKAHEDIRVLGNDVLHDDWHEIQEDDVQAARHYTQRILEDLYDDREAVLKLLRKANKVPEEDRAK